MNDETPSFDIDKDVSNNSPVKETTTGAKPRDSKSNENTSKAYAPNVQQIVVYSNNSNLTSQLLPALSSLIASTSVAASTSTQEEERSKKLKLLEEGGGKENNLVQLKIPKFFYQKALCRVCLVEKKMTKSIFENLSIDERGCIENSRGHVARYRIAEAMKTLLNVEAQPGDGLPDQICTQCLDTLLSFSVFRKQTFLAQSKLQVVFDQVEDSETPTFIPSLGEKDTRNTDIFKHSEKIFAAKEILQSSKFCHMVRRNVSDRIWDYVFQVFSTLTGTKSDKMDLLVDYTFSKPYVTGWLCSQCNQFVHGSLEEVRKHHSEVHGTDSEGYVLYPCDVCGFEFPLKAEHGVAKKYALHWLEHFLTHSCDVCLKRLPSQKAVRSHNARFHQNHDNKSFVCEICHKAFTRRGHLESHLKIHNENEDVKVNVHDICGQTTLSSSLPRHIKFSCEVCDKCFKTNRALKIHLRYHSGEQSHMCETCGQRFYSKNALKSHLVKHSNADIPCPEPGCDKLFKRKLYLKEHLRLHTGEKPFSCEICGKQVRMKSNLLKHMKIHKKKDSDDKTESSDAEEAIEDFQM